MAAGFSGHGFKLSPAVGRHDGGAHHGRAGPGTGPATPSAWPGFAEGKPIRGTYGDWLMC